MKINLETQALNSINPKNHRSVIEKTLRDIKSALRSNDPFDAVFYLQEQWVKISPKCRSHLNDKWNWDDVFFLYYVSWAYLVDRHDSGEFLYRVMEKWGLEDIYCSRQSGIVACYQAIQKRKCLLDLRTENVLETTRSKLPKNPRVVEVKLKAA